MKQFILLISSVIYILASCSENKVIYDSKPVSPWGPASKNFVNAYVYPTLEDAKTSYYIETWEGVRADSFKLDESSLIIILYFNTPEEDITRERLYVNELWYQQEKVSMFRKLAIKNKDTSFYQDGVFGSCLADPIESLNIVSDSDYDDAHPAGTSLNDIIYVEFRSATEFVESGYTNEWYSVKKNPYDLHFIEPLAQFLAKKRNLVNECFGFIFHHLPTKVLEHNFTIYYDDAAGRHLEIPVESVSVAKDAAK
jgi:hypothetical protein